MRRPAVRFLLTLVCATSVFGVVPATSEAGIIPWAWDTMFGPLGSIQARRTARYGSGYGGDSCAFGSCYGPAPRMYSGFRGWQGYSAGGCGCASSGCNGCGTSSYGMSGGYASNGCSSCGTGGSGCSSCGTGFSGYDGGYISTPYGAGGGGCANGQCNVNYPPAPSGQNCATDPNATPSLTPTPASGGPAPVKSNGTPADNEQFMPPTTPRGANTNDGFKPAATNKTPAPTGGDPTKDENYQPPKVTPAPEPGPPAVGADTGTPPVEPQPEPSPKKNKLTEGDDKGTSIGPRLELDNKVTWRSRFTRTRLAQSAVRVSASANRPGLFAKNIWHAGSETELAKK